MLMLRLAIVVLRDLPIFNLLSVDNPTFKFVLMLLHTYAKPPQDSLASRLAVNIATTHQAEDLHHHYLFDAEAPRASPRYSLFELASLLLCIVAVAGSTLFPKKVRKIEKAMLVLYPLCWLAVYSMLGSIDSLQLQVYGYLTAEVVLMLR